MSADTVYFWANCVLVAALVVGLFATVATVLSGHNRDRELKEELSNKDVKIAEANERGEEANVSAARSNERAAILEKDAASARLEQVQLKVNIAELEKSSDVLKERTANAEKDAAEARLSLEKIKAPRVLSVEQIGRIREKLRHFSGIRFRVASVADEEAKQLANSIREALTASGWNYKNQKTMLWGSGTGLEVRIHSNWPAQLKEAASSLVFVLKAQGMGDVKVYLNSLEGPSEEKYEEISIHVLSKPISAAQ